MFERNKAGTWPQAWLPSDRCCSSAVALAGFVLLFALSVPAAAQSQESSESQPASQESEAESDEGEFLFVRASGDKTQFLRGESKELISARTFFLELDRKDLAEEYDRRKRKKKRLIIAGSATMAASVVLFGVGYATRPSARGCADEPTLFGPGNCSGDDIAHLASFGAGSSLIFSIGLGITLTGIHRSPLPIDIDRATDLADEHNDRVRGTSSVPTSHDRSSEPIGIQIGVGRLRQAVGMFVTGRF